MAIAMSPMSRTWSMIPIGSGIGDEHGNHAGDGQTQGYDRGGLLGRECDAEACQQKRDAPPCARLAELGDGIGPEAAFESAEDGGGWWGHVRFIGAILQDVDRGWGIGYTSKIDSFEVIRATTVCALR